MINFGSTFADTHLKFFADSGSTLPLPLTFGGTSTTASSVDQTLAPHAHLVIQSNAMDGAPLQIGSAQLTTNGKVSGFIRFRYGPRDQEAIVPIESRNDGSYVLAFDNTGGLETGVAVANQSAQPVTIGPVIRDNTGAPFGLGTVQLRRMATVPSYFPANSHPPEISAGPWNS